MKKEVRTGQWELQWGHTEGRLQHSPQAVGHHFLGQAALLGSRIKAQELLLLSAAQGSMP